MPNYAFEINKMQPILVHICTYTHLSKSPPMLQMSQHTCTYIYILYMKYSSMIVELLLFYHNLAMAINRRQVGQRWFGVIIIWLDNYWVSRNAALNTHSLYSELYICEKDHVLFVYSCLILHYIICAKPLFCKHNNLCMYALHTYECTLLYLFCV